MKISEQIHSCIYRRSGRGSLIILFIVLALKTTGQSGGYFTNPLQEGGADPWITRHDGWYYFTRTTGNRIELKRGRNLDDLFASESVRVWTPPQGTMWSKEIWAPEIHNLDGKWYVYFAADDGKNVNHRMYVIENESDNPMEGEWIFRGKISDPSDRWAIDGTVFTYGSKRYFVWSGWEGGTNGRQDIYIAEMENPWTIRGSRMLLSRPEYPWETVGDLNNPDDVQHVDVNEGPAVLINGKKIFVTYSASGCWTDSYCIGMVVYDGRGRITDRRSWRKLDKPVLTGDPSLAVFAPGHNSFFKSPDGSEDWIIYHANPRAGQGCGRYRSPRAQKIGWDKEGMPVIGNPAATGVKTVLPAAER